MAQDGDTITYTHNGGTTPDEVRRSEDISSIDRITVDYCDGAGGRADDGPAGSGGRVANAEFDVSGFDTLYIWVAGHTKYGMGRYEGDRFAEGGDGGGTSEVSFYKTDVNDSTDEPFLAASAGGGGGYLEGFYSSSPGGKGARRLDSSPIPEGGEGGTTSSPVGDGDAAVDDQNRGYVINSGTTTTGGGSGEDEDGEVRITYESLGPDAPSNVAITDSQTEGELTVDWDEVGSATGYYVYRAQTSGSAKSDYTQVADVTSPAYTDTELEDGEQYYYRVSSYN